MRVPFVARWPGRIPAGTVVREPAMTIDVLPTIARLVGAPLPERPIDGLDISPLLLGEPGARSPHEALLFYYGTELRAVRGGRYKLVLPHRSQTLDGPAGSGGIPGKYKQADVPLALYDLVADVGETTDVAAAHPDVVERLLGRRREGPRRPRRLADEPDRPRHSRARARAVRRDERQPPLARDRRSWPTVFVCLPSGFSSWPTTPSRAPGCALWPRRRGSR